MRYAQLVMGPAGSGKSTYCSTIARHGQNINRQINIVNLDPAAEKFDYEAIADIRHLIHLDDVMEDEDLRFGPNGGLIFCLEYLLENSEWLQEQLDEVSDDYILFDCPGQIELFTHLNIMHRLVDFLQSLDFRICGVFLIDSQFMVDLSKFVAGVMTTLSAMVNLEIPHVNILAKIDLLNRQGQKQLSRFLEPDVYHLLEEEQGYSKWNKKYQKLNEIIGKLVDDYSLVKFLPLNINDEESIGDLLISVDNALQYGEDEECKTKVFEDEDSESENGVC